MRNRMVVWLTLLFLISGVTTRAATYYWDAGGGDLGGSGVWDATGTLWRSGSSSGSLQSWTQFSDAVFSGTSGTVSLTAFGAEPLAVASMTVQTGGYAFQGDTIARVLKLTGTFTADTADNTLITVGSLVANQGLTIDMDGTARTFVIQAGDRVEFLNELTNGSGTLTKSGAGTMILSGSSDYAAETAITAGYLRLRNGSALGGTSAGTTVSSGASLELEGNITIEGEALTLNGAGADGSGALRNVSGTNTYRGPIALALASTITSEGGILVIDAASGDAVSGEQALTFTGEGDTVVAATIATGTGSLTKSGSGKLTLSASNNYTGDTNINGGVLELTATSGGFGISGTIAFNGGILRLAAAGIADLSYRFSAAIGQHFAFDIAVPEVTFAGDIASTGGDLIKLGAGTLILTGTNSYSGGTTISYGVLQVGDDGSAGTLGSGPVTNDGVLLFKRSDNFTVSNAIGGTGNLIKAGVGVLSLDGANTYSGSTYINDGVLALNHTASLGGGGPIIFGGGMLRYSPQNFHDFSNRFTTVPSQNFKIDTNGQDVTFTHDILSPGGRIEKYGAGRLTLTGSDSFSGGIMIISGTLQVGADGTTGALGIGSIENNGTLTFSRSDDIVVDNMISGFGQLIKTSPGKLVLTAMNNYSGGTRISQGELQIGDGGSTGALGSGPVTNSGSLIFDRSNDFLVTNVISGPGSLVKNGPGKLTLSAVSNYSGPTTVNDGILSIDGRISSETSVEAGAAVSGAGVIQNGVTIKTGGTIAPSLETLTANNLTIESGGVFKLQLAIDSSGTFRGSKLVLNGGVGNGLVIQPGGLLELTNLGSDSFVTPGLKLALIDYTGAADGWVGAFTLLGVPLTDGAIFEAFNNHWQIDYNDTVDESGNSGQFVTVTASIVPEASTTTMIVGIAGLYFLTNQRRRPQKV